MAIGCVFREIHRLAPHATVRVARVKPDF
jgi:hypothetical protein